MNDQNMLMDIATLEPIRNGAAGLEANKFDFWKYYVETEGSGCDGWERF